MILPPIEFMQFSAEILMFYKTSISKTHSKTILKSFCNAITKKISLCNIIDFTNDFASYRVYAVFRRDIDVL
jgi:hypothetical protein